MHLKSIFLFCASVSALMACSSTPDPAVPDDPCGPGQYCAAPTPTMTTPVATTTTTAPATPSGAATPIPAVAAMAATPALQGLALSEAPGMQADGGPFAGQFQEGQVLEQAINISAGKCYTIIGVGLGIAELDIQLAAQPVPQAPPVVLAQDNTNGAMAVVGGKASGCWKNPTPIGGPGKVLVKATKGGGVAAVQVYVK